MGMLPEKGSYFFPVNYPDKKPLCPSLGIIDVCAKLIDFDWSKNDKFCGVNKLWGKRLGGERSTVTSCCKDTWAALYLSHFVITGKTELDIMGSEAISILGKDRATIYVKKGEKEGVQILENWRQVIWETCCVPEGENPHFRTIKSPSELSDEEVLSRVKDFAVALSNVSKNCPQKPLITDPFETM